MKKSEQQEINVKAMEILERLNNELKATENKKFKRLRTCQAEVCETSSFYVLRSYNTIVACIEKSTDTLVDALRYVYGYTATSAKHIAKFNQDYCTGKWGCETRLTMREI